jgi:hypothetical protein
VKALSLKEDLKVAAGSSEYKDEGNQTMARGWELFGPDTCRMIPKSSLRSATDDIMM